LQRIALDLRSNVLAALRRWGKSNGRPDKSCADPADILVGIAVLETPSREINRTRSPPRSDLRLPALRKAMGRAPCRLTNFSAKRNFGLKSLTRL
jgi:hypothetical protein